mmetsp:Transcript_6350/g.9508  ORF Transcript_6350/g.9508 Transcript_6350/m.9508 type:complete len:230 (-) Transcript_6350:7-696(-)
MQTSIAVNSNLNDSSKKINNEKFKRKTIKLNAKRTFDAGFREKKYTGMYSVEPITNPAILNKKSMDILNNITKFDFEGGKFILNSKYKSNSNKFNAIKIKNANTRFLKKKNIGSINKGSHYEITYDTLQPLVSAWKTYAINNEFEKKFHKFVKFFDLNGAQVNILKSRTGSYVGIEGIIFEETNELFIIMGKNNIAKRIAKVGTIFEIPLENKKYILDGEVRNIETPRI